MSLADLIESSVVGTAKRAKDLQSAAKEAKSELKRVGEKIFGDNDQDEDNKLKSESDNDKENQSDSSENERKPSKMDRDPFALDKLQYPVEIQSLDDPDGPIKHWVTFYISEFESSKYASKTENFVSPEQQDAVLGGGYSSTKLAQLRPPSISDPNNRDLFSEQNLKGGAAGAAIGAGLAFAQNFSSKFGLSSGKQTTSAPQGAFIGVTQNIISQRPKTKMLKKTINIYMPDTLMTTQNHGYENVSLTDMFGDVGALMQIGSPMMEGAFKGEGKDVGSSIVGGLKGIGQGMPSAGAAEVIGRLGESIGDMNSKFKDALVRSQGFAINPQVELFFTGTDRREFQFDFRFNSRSAKETEQIQKIIKSFRMHSAPSMPADSVGTGARYFVPPSQFDIKFYFRNDGQSIENPYLAKIGTCVLERVDVNYVGSGKFMTFEDGQPVDIEVRLSFREVDIMTREAIEEGY
jgi:hypothetical protein